MPENKLPEELQAKRQRLRSQVVMPDTIEEPKMNVGGTKEYRRSAIGMIAAGVFIIGITMTMFWVTGRFLIFVPIFGWAAIGFGIARLSEKSPSGPE